MIDQHAEKAKKVISSILYITIATATKDGKPWNTPVYSAYDETYTFYWTSWKDNVHSINIQNNPHVFIVIYNSTAPEYSGFGVYIQAKAVEVSDEDEIELGLKYLYNRVNKPPVTKELLMGENPMRLYKAVPEKIWVNEDAFINGKSITIRRKIILP